ISKPGLRVYANSTGLPKNLGGLGVEIISPPQILLTALPANSNKVSEDVVAYAWHGAEQPHVLARLRSPTRPASTSTSTVRPAASRARRSNSPRTSPSPSR